MSRKKQKSRGRRFVNFLFVAFWLFLAAMFAGFMVIQSERSENYRAELDKVFSDLQREWDAHDDLTAQMGFYESDAYIEQLAREQLGYVKPGEIVFINVPD
ncbi:MAG: septum formation initiator family protein [Defluviitaleaceae bacterium]|nr:septum formation initiator family protein [Defluviitaleaceae bacterium]